MTERSKKTIRKTESCRVMRGAWGSFRIHSRVPLRSFCQKAEMRRRRRDWPLHQAALFGALRLIGWPISKSRWYHAALVPVVLAFWQGLFFLLRKKSDMLLRSVKYRLRRCEIFACKQAKVKCSLRERWGSFFASLKNKLLKKLVKYKPRAWTLG